MNKPAKLLSIFLLSLVLAACGSSDEPNFSGTWDGSFTRFDNSCPFPVNSNLGSVFPMVVNEDAAGVVTVLAANGDLATGGQGVGETISFTANSSSFGSFGTTAPYVCTASPYTLGYVEQGDNKADVTTYVTFTNCTVAGGSSTTSCSVLYSGSATKR